MAELTETDRLCRQSIQKYLDVRAFMSGKGYYLRLRSHDSLVVRCARSKKPYETFYWNNQAVSMAIFTTFFAAENMEAKEAFDELKKMAPRTG